MILKLEHLTSKNAILIFTKSDLVKNPQERAKKIYQKLNLEMPYVLSFGDL